VNQRLAAQACILPERYKVTRRCPKSSDLAASSCALSANRSNTSSKAGSIPLADLREALAAQAENVYIRRN
jgi:hypothetical protein